MARFKAKYGAHVREAITRAVAAGMDTKTIHAKLADGSLDGLDGKPCPYSPRRVGSFVSLAREQIREGGWDEKTGPELTLDLREHSPTELLEQLAEWEGGPAVVVIHPNGRPQVRGPNLARVYLAYLAERETPESVVA